MKNKIESISVKATGITIGMFLASAAGLVMAVPALLPLARAMHIDLAQLALILVFDVNMSLLTIAVCITLKHVLLYCWCRFRKIR